MAYVNNVFEMAKHVSHHRSRLYKLGMEVKGPRLLKMIIFGCHDIEKYIVLPWLWKYYGAKGNETRQIKRNAIKLFTRMNKIGYFILDVMIKLPSLFYSKEEISRLKRFEKIIDVIDRHCDPVAMEEFNLKIQRPLTDFLSIKDLPIAIKVKQRWLNHFS